MPASGERILALDLGASRIGLAVSDELGWTAHGLPTLERVGPKKDFAKLRDIVAQYHVQKLVVGLPRNMNGSLGPQANLALEFIEQVKSKLNLDVIPWDERLTTQAAQRVLLEADMSRAKRRKKVDQVAAVLILQGYLDSRRGLLETASQPEAS
ncbi:MAG TPA: Holliday junction resolvase RuvX [Nitrospiria bacterium]|nr:Holliday junction resolvase RuvX [Nitrospiria bacterium]